MIGPKLNQRAGQYELWANYQPPDTIPQRTRKRCTWWRPRFSARRVQCRDDRRMVAHSGAGELTLFDMGGAGYVAFDSWSTELKVVVEQLTPDFTDSLGFNA